jgi:hypothetical protein
MILRLSNDRIRAAAVFGRYFRSPNVTWTIVDGCAVAYAVEAEPRLDKKGEAAGYVLKSPEIIPAEGMRGVLLLSTHPALGGEAKLITPDAKPPQGYLTIKTSSLDPHNLPYHFRVSILPHGHMA